MAQAARCCRAARLRHSWAVSRARAGSALYSGSDRRGGGAIWLVVRTRAINLCGWPADLANIPPLVRLQHRQGGGEKRRPLAGGLLRRCAPLSSVGVRLTSRPALPVLPPAVLRPCLRSRCRVCGRWGVGVLSSGRCAVSAVVAFGGSRSVSSCPLAVSVVRSVTGFIFGGVVTRPRALGSLRSDTRQSSTTAHRPGLGADHSQHSTPSRIATASSNA